MSFCCWEETQPTFSCFQVFANETLRTLCLCYKDISAEEYEVWSRQHKEAQVTVSDRDAALDRVYELIENNLMVSGERHASRSTCKTPRFNNHELRLRLVISFPAFS